MEFLRGSFLTPKIPQCGERERERERERESPRRENRGPSPMRGDNAKSEGFERDFPRWFFYIISWFNHNTLILSYHFAKFHVFYDGILSHHITIKRAIWSARFHLLLGKLGTIFTLV